MGAKDIAERVVREDVLARKLFVHTVITHDDRLYRQQEVDETARE
jgi:hypothetical protein